MAHRYFDKKTLQSMAIIFMLVGAGWLHGQVITGAISGNVTDSTGAAVSGATVTVTNQGTGVSQVLTTDSSGFYSAEGLSVALYTIDISKAGFKENVTKGIQLNPGQRRANNVVLEVGSATSKVTVTADVEQVNTQTSESSGTLSSKQISNLMLNGRNFQTLAIAIPGVESTAGANELYGTGTTLIINGVSTQYTTYTIDGTYNMNSGSLGSVNIIPIVDGISEFSVLKDNYSAKYGFAGSGQVVVETKSGTDTYHGSAWDYLRNNAFDANNYYSIVTQPLHQNIFGYTMGGPLIVPKIYNGNSGSKKTFFFASNQWYVINAGEVLRGAVFPQAMRNGNFSASPTLKGSLALDAHSQALLASQGRTNCILGPKTLNPACFDPVAVAIMNAYFPLPNNIPGGFLNYTNSGSHTTSELDYQYRVDHYINKNNQLMTRIDYSPVDNKFPNQSWGGVPFSTIKDFNYTTAFNGLVRLQSTITPSLLNSVGVAYTDDKPRIAQFPGQGLLPSGVSITQAFPSAPTQGLIPNIGIAEGWTGDGLHSQPITASDGEGTMSDDVSWVKGNHVLQAGALYIFGIKRQNVFTNPQGSFTFSGVHTGDPAADYLLGLDSSYSQSSSQKLGSYHYRQGEAYVQDNWRVSPRLTLNLGVRWQYFSNDTVSGDQVTSFNPTLYNPAQAPVVNINGTLQVNNQNQPINATGQPANLLNGLAFAGKNGVPSGFFIPDKENFGPRAGFAYDVFGDGKTSIRGGYGIGYTRLPLETIYGAFGQNPPYNLSTNVLNSSLSNGTAGTAAAPTTQTLNNVPFNFVPAQIQSYSLTLEHQVENNMVASLAYAGSQGRHLTGSQDINFPLPVSTASTSNCLAQGQGASSSYDFDPCINTGKSSPNYTRPYKGYSAINNNEYDEGSSNYNALESGLTYRTGSTQFSLAYTYSKVLTTIPVLGAGQTTSIGSTAQNPRNFHAEYGPPSYDFTNDFTATWVYSIPYFSHGSKPIALALGNWSFAGLALHQSGFAMSPSMATSTAGLARRPNQVAPYHQVGKLSEWFDTSTFAAPNYGFFGNASNGTIRGPGYTSINISLYKTFPITHRLNTQFRAEAFNVANHPNFESVDTALGSGAYGQVTSAGDPRILEFAIKIIY